MPRYEFSEGSSNKFWEIKLDGTSFTTTYGKIGTTGQTTIKTYKTAEQAQREYDKLIAEKTKKGYQLAGGTAGRPAQQGSPGKTTGAGTGDKRNPEFEKAIIANPYDRDVYAVYGDWLQGQGDPRGELIALQLAGKDKEARALIDKNADYFLGPLVEHQKTYDGDLSNNGRTNDKAWVAENKQAFLWKFGFIHRARLAHDSYDDDGFEGSLVDVLELLLRHPSGRFVTEMAFNNNGDPNEDDLQDLIDVLARKAPPTLRKLTFGDNVDQISWYNVGNLGKLWAAVPNLATLYIEAGSWTLGTLDAPSLRRAEFKTGGLSKASGTSIATAHWPRIEFLDVYYGDTNYGGDCTLKEVQPLLDRSDLSALTHLGLKNSSFTDELCQVIGHAKIVKQLKELDLSMGCMSDAGAAALAAWKPALGHLEVLDVSDNYLSEEGEKAVKGLARKVIIGEQRDDDDPEYRHPSVGE